MNSVQYVCREKSNTYICVLNETIEASQFRLNIHDYLQKSEPNDSNRMPVEMIRVVDVESYSDAFLPTKAESCYTGCNENLLFEQ